jgi:hypothetical protein
MHTTPFSFFIILLLFVFVLNFFLFKLTLLFSNYLPIFYLDFSSPIILFSSLPPTRKFFFSFLVTAYLILISLLLFFTFPHVRISSCHNNVVFYLKLIVNILIFTYFYTLKPNEDPFFTSFVRSIAIFSLILYLSNIFSSIRLMNFVLHVLAVFYIIVFNQFRTF